MRNSAYHIRDLFNAAGWLSLSRLAFAASFPFVVDRPALALAVVAAAGVSDFLDGYVARRYHQNTPTGAALDPVTDKIFATTVMVTLIAAGRLPVSWAILLSLRELVELPLVLWLLSVPRARVARAVHLESNLVGKLTTALQFGALCSLLFGQPIFTWWITATAVFGLIAGITYWINFRAALQRSPADG